MSIDADLTFGTGVSAKLQLRGKTDAHRAAVAANAYRFCVLATHDDIQAIQAQWQALERASHGTAVFQSSTKRPLVIVIVDICVVTSSYTNFIANSRPLQEARCRTQPQA